MAAFFYVCASVVGFIRAYGDEHCACEPLFLTSLGL